VEDPGERSRLSATLGLAVLACGAALLAIGLALDWTALLALIGFPVHELSNRWVLGDLKVIRSVCVLLGALLIAAEIGIRWQRRPTAAIAARLTALAAAASRQTLVAPMSVGTLILATLVLQLVLFMLGYAAFSADDFGRPMSAAFWLRFRRMDFGMDGWLGLAGSGWLPFSDYIFAAGLAVHPDLFVTPRVVNLIVSSLAVISAYYLGRELFGRAVGVMTAVLFTFQPWHVWLGMSGMSSDLPSVALIPLFGLFLIRWLRSDDGLSLVCAAGVLAVSNGFRYENWLFAVIFSILILMAGLERWRARRLSPRWIRTAVFALVIANALPVVWMAGSYVMYGDWLPAMHGINAFMVAFMTSQTTRTETQMGIPLMAAGSFPFEIALSVAGILLYPSETYRVRPIRIYLVVVVATLLLFAVVFRGQLAAWLHIARYLLGFVVLALPFAGLLIVRLFRLAEPLRLEGVMAACVVVVTVCFFDVSRALNYPNSFPRDAIDMGWMVRGLQRSGSLQEDAKILIERSPDFGDLSIVALANRPERFVVLNELAYRRTALSGLLANTQALMPAAVDEGVRGTVCQLDFAVPACRDSVLSEGFRLAILSSPERVDSFRRTFQAPSWNIGRYYVFDMSTSPPSQASREPSEHPDRSDVSRP
jgi:hypothetical protein